MHRSGGLETQLSAAGVEERLVEQLAQYCTMLLETNRRFNVTGADTAEEIVPHILDSLGIVQFIRGPLVDIGSGGGLPAIPIAIATGVEVTMVESTTKKAAFLEAVLGTLHLAGRVVPQRAELAGRDPSLREQFACATARAVSSLPTVLELAVPFLQVGGVAVLQRGRLDERERNAAMDAAPILGAGISDEVPQAGGRRIIVARKIAQTSNRFPRRTGIPEKHPLCLS